MDVLNRGWMVAVGALLLALPLWILFWFGESFNDKPYGWHAWPGGYVVIGIAALLAATAAWGLVSVAVHPDLRGRMYWPIIGLVGCALVLTYCLWWGRWLTEYRDLQGQPTASPVRDRP